MEHDYLERLPYYDEEEVVGSSSKYHRPSCHLIRNIYRRNLKKFRSWENAVALGLEPCGVCSPCWKPAPKAPTMPAHSPVNGLEGIVSTSQLADWRHQIVQLLNALDQGGIRPEGEGVAGRIVRLSKAGKIPREIGAMMRTITEMRNAAEYQSKTLSAAESDVVAATWVAIQKWVQTTGLKFKS